MTNAWVQGSGYVLHRECIEECGPIQEEHMDDPRSKYCMVKSNDDFLEKRPSSAVVDKVTSLAQWPERVKHMARVDFGSTRPPAKCL